MKVTDFKTMVVENEPPYIGGKYLLFLEIYTDEGITGLGERITGGAYSQNLADLKTQIGLIEEMVRNYVIGENPFNIERTWDRMYASRHDFRHPSLYATPVISAIDMALWDIAGKAANQPIYNLLGGKYHETLRAYAYMPGGAFQDNPEAAGEVAAQLLEEGNTACKIDPFPPSYPIPRDIPTLGNRTRREDIREHPKRRRQQPGGRDWHAWSVDDLQRYPRRRLPGTLSPLLVRGAGPAGKHRRDGESRRTHQHPDSHR